MPFDRLSLGGKWLDTDYMCFFFFSSLPPAFFPFSTSMVFQQGMDNHFNYFLQPVPSWEYNCLTFYFWSGCCGVQNSVHCYFATLQHLTDVEDVKFVINYDYPNSSEDYIHRIGRTARSTKTGTAYTFFTPNNIKQVSDLISVLREANQAINPKLLQLVEDRGSGRSRGRGGMKDDRRDRYSAGKRGGFNNFRDRENYDRGYSSLLKRDFGAKTQNGVYSAAANYTNGSFGSNFVSAGIQTSFRTGNPTGTYQNGYDSTQQYGSNVANMHNGMNQQAYAYPATAAAPMIGYPMPTGYSQ